MDSPPRTLEDAMKFTFEAIAVLLLAGCASVAVNGDILEKRTAYALGLAPSNFVITSRVNDGVRTDYVVKTKSNKIYNCYVTGTYSVMGRVVSDAICSSGNGSSANPDDNSLARAAKAKNL